MYEVFSALDIVVLTSLNEGTPVSLIEAQLSGKPVVAYDVGGVKDTFINAASGYLVEKGDIETFANKLEKLINDKPLRQQMGERGRRFCKDKFSKQTEVAAIDALYKNILAGKKVNVCKGS
jgi:glycosyltransferase involved in cell wall biosynthesis